MLTSQSKSKGNCIHHIYLPGDIIGLAEIGVPVATHQVRMQTDGAISNASREAFCDDMRQHARLGALLTALGSLDLLALRNQNACMRTMDGSQKLKFFLLQLRSRQLVDGIGDGDRFEVPFSQVEIGQAIGMTSIYVNKLLRGFRDAGELEVSRPYYRVLKRESWEMDTEFVDAYKHIDTSWFPPIHEKEPSGLGRDLADPPDKGVRLRG